MAMSGLTSAWMEGRHCPLAARGYSRDGKRARLQIEYGLLTDPDGRPVAVRVFEGSTADPAAFTEIVTVVREKFGLPEMVMVGDRGMITAARISALRELEDPIGSVTALRAPAIKKLVADRARTREDLLAATEKLLAPIIARVQSGRLAGAAEIDVAVGQVIGTYKVAKHFEVTITDTSLTVQRRKAQIDAEAAFDGIYVLVRPSRPATSTSLAWSPPTKNLARAGRDFRVIKTGDLDLHISDAVTSV